MDFYLVRRFTPSDFPLSVKVFRSYLGCGRFESRVDHLNVVLMTEMRSCLQSLRASSGTPYVMYTLSFFRTCSNSPFTVTHS